MGVPIVTPTVGGDNNSWGTELNTILNALNGADYFAKRTSDGSSINSVTLADDAVLQMTLPVGTFRVEAVVLATSPSGSDMKMAWAFSGTTTSAYRSGIGPTIQTTSVISATAATTVGVVRSAAAGDTSTAITSSTPYGTDGTNITRVSETGFLVVTVSGLLKLQFAQVVAAASMVVKAGSFLYARQVA